MTEKNKLFKYFDGVSEVYGDPFEIVYRFEQAAMDRNVDLNLLDERLSKTPLKEDGSIDSDRMNKGDQMLFLESCHQFVPLIAAALDIKPFDKKTGEGMQSLDIMASWRQFHEWQAGVKKNIEPPPDSPTPTTESGPSISPQGLSMEAAHSPPRQSMAST